MAALHFKAPSPRDLVADAAKQAFEEAGGDVRAATAKLEARVRAEYGLREALTDPLISNACYEAVRRQVQGARKAVWNPPARTEKFTPSKVSGAYRVTQLAAGTLLMFPLPGGKKLGDATREEISAAASFYESQAEDMGTKARWLRLVAQSMPTTATAGDVLTDGRLRELQEAARVG
ncbi:hypothetical protein [Methylobacterium iners]|uniref:Uncharacterized protein n=1 Tax=Methylobacterium iners TaxID=418707 RepID=A0ABQ4RQA7_9HYPH|nr:hypothetical protein [Methylobacterium iners]GJD92941.1 hypothetical protein OCOJLMKI_0124 [Methylobacterium iners]